MSICRGGSFTRRTFKQNGFADLLLPLTGFRFFRGFSERPFPHLLRALSCGRVQTAQHMTISCGELSPNQRV